MADYTNTYNTTTNTYTDMTYLNIILFYFEHSSLSNQNSITIHMMNMIFGYFN